MNYYKVSTLRGHQGRGRFVDITFYVIAKDALHAMNIAKKKPGVKHSRMVISCKQITAQEYIEGRKFSAYHPSGF